MGLGSGTHWVVGLLLAPVSTKPTPLPVDISSDALPCYSDEDCLSTEVCQREVDARTGFCAFSNEPSDADLQREMGTQVLTGGGLNVTMLALNSGPGKEASIRFGSGVDTWAIKQAGDNDLVIAKGACPLFSISPEGNLLVFGKLHTAGKLKIRGQLNYNGKFQWFLAHSENFDKKGGAKGWSKTDTSKCGSAEKSMLGGYGKFAGGEVSKKYTNLVAKHKELRITANFHFIDSWESETAYMKVDDGYYWTDIYDYQVARTGINICGSVAAEGKYTVKIDTVLPHNSSSFTLTFGTTLDQSPFDESWGVDDIQIYVR